jgi:hypothetical protein
VLQGGSYFCYNLLLRGGGGCQKMPLRNLWTTPGTIFIVVDQLTCFSRFIYSYITCLIYLRYNGELASSQPLLLNCLSWSNFANNWPQTWLFHSVMHCNRINIQKLQMMFNRLDRKSVLNWIKINAHQNQNNNR